MRYLMITHDQDIDRRILQQAQALEEVGWTGAIVCLSFDNADNPGVEDGREVHRIGLSRIVPGCDVFRAYNRRQGAILEWSYARPHGYLRGRRPWTRGVNGLFKVASKANWWLYKLHLLAYYQSRKIACPLPFDECFYTAASSFAADLIVAHDLPALPAAQRLARQRGVPLVYDAHELYYEQAAFSARQKEMMREEEARLIHQCQAVFTVNDSIAQEMARRYGCPAPRVLLNAIDPPAQFDPHVRGDLLRQRLGVEAGRKIVLFQGGLLANRNLENLLRSAAMAKNPGWVLVFMGNGPLRERLEGLALRARCQDRVKFVPAVPPGELVRWTASADVGVVPYAPVDLNTRFCTPNKLFEYIQAAVPILANDLPELQRYVRDTGFGRVMDMTQPRLLAAKIDAFVADAPAMAAARSAMLQRRGEFTWRHAQAAYLQTIDSVLAARGRTENALA